MPGSLVFDLFAPSMLAYNKGTLLAAVKFSIRHPPSSASGDAEKAKECIGLSIDPQWLSLRLGRIRVCQ
jgi:hypothetical protein